MSTRYPMRAFYADGSSKLVQSADEELALPAGWQETPEAFAPGYVAPNPLNAYVPTANAQVMQQLSEIDQARLRAQQQAAQPTVVPDSKLAALEAQFENHALEMIGLKARIGVLETRMRDVEELLTAVQSRPFDGPAPDPFVPLSATDQPEPEPPVATVGTGKRTGKK